MQINRSKAGRNKISIPDRRNELQNNVTFQCDTCGKSFSRKSKLIMYEKLNCENLLHCEVCGRTFTRKNDFNMHMITHTG